MDGFIVRVNWTKQNIISKSKCFVVLNQKQKLLWWQRMTPPLSLYVYYYISICAGVWVSPILVSLHEPGLVLVKFLLPEESSGVRSKPALYLCVCLRLGYVHVCLGVYSLPYQLKVFEKCVLDPLMSHTIISAAKAPGRGRLDFPTCTGVGVLPWPLLTGIFQDQSGWHPSLSISLSHLSLSFSLIRIPLFLSLSISDGGWDIARYPNRNAVL